MDRSHLEHWLLRYGLAWEQKDVEAFVSLFDPDVRYYWTPFGPPKAGRIELGTVFDSATTKQRSIRFGAEVLSVRDESGIAHWSCSFERPDSGRRVHLDGIFLVQFGRDGLCDVFREWWHSDEIVQHVQSA